MYKKLAQFGIEQYKLFIPKTKVVKRKQLRSLWGIYAVSALFFSGIFLVYSSVPYMKFYTKGLGYCLIIPYCVYGLTLLVAGFGGILKQHYRFRIYMLIIVVILFPTSFWILGVSVTEASGTPTFLLIYTLSAWVSGILFNVWIHLRTVRLIANGRYREGGTGFFNKKNSRIVEIVCAIIAPFGSSLGIIVITWGTVRNNIRKWTGYVYVAHDFRDAMVLSCCVFVLFCLMSIIINRQFILLHLHKKFGIKEEME